MDKDYEKVQDAIKKKKKPKRDNKSMSRSLSLCLQVMTIKTRTAQVLSCHSLRLSRIKEG